MRTEKNAAARSAATLPFKKKFTVETSREEEDAYWNIYNFAEALKAPRPLHVRVVFSARNNPTLQSFKKIRRGTAEIEKFTNWSDHFSHREWAWYTDI